MKKAELLSPCGGFEQFKAAVNNGADAVYMGGPLFNARRRAENFSMDEMREAIDIGHDKGVKSYVTINTLLADDEIPEVMEYVYHLDKMQADALIVQNYGLGTLIKREFPEIDLHLSTQGTIYNREGARFAAQMGYSRVVVARECSLEDIRDIRKEFSGEIEAFIHGAMCISYSGQCQFSNFIGGRSGNKGVCGQACRLPYNVTDNVEGIRKKRSHEGFRQTDAGSYFLSPKDMCAAGSIGDMIDAGVYSLKIEGRMKSAEYVAAVTGIYRKQLDLYMETGRTDSKVSEDDMKVLKQIFNRGGFSEGYLRGNPKADLMYRDLPKHMGVEIGSVSRDKFSGTRVYANMSEKLSIGDGVEIRSRYGIAGNVISYINSDGKETAFGDIRDDVKRGDKIYRITDKKLMNSLRETYRERFVPKGMPVEMRFKTDAGGILLSISGEVDAVIYEETVLEQAHTKPTEKEQIKKQLSKTGGSGIFPESIDVVLHEENLMIPVAAINGIRRKCTEQFFQKLNEKRSEESRMLRDRISTEIKEFKNSHPQPTNENAGLDQDSDTPLKTLYLYSMSEFKNEDAFKYYRIYVPYYEMIESNLLSDLEKGSRETKPIFVPYIPQVTQGYHDERIRRDFDKIAASARERGILIGNQSWIKPFLDAGVDVFGDFGMNAYNVYDVRLYEEMGLKGLCMSLETSFDSNKNELPVSNMKMEITAGGDIPLMVSAHDFVADVKGCGEEDNVFITDRKNQEYRIRRIDGEGHNVITGNCEFSGLEDVFEYYKNNGIYLRYFR